MIETTNDSGPAPATAAADPGPQSPDIVVHVADLLAREVGPLHHIDTRSIDEWTVAWAGVDQSGKLLSGKLTHDFAVGDDGRSIVLGWNVVLDAAGT